MAVKIDPETIREVSKHKYLKGILIAVCASLVIILLVIAFVISKSHSKISKDGVEVNIPEPKIVVTDTQPSKTEIKIENPVFNGPTQVGPNNVQNNYFGPIITESEINDVVKRIEKVRKENGYKEKLVNVQTSLSTNAGDIPIKLRDYLRKKGYKVFDKIGINTHGDGNGIDVFANTLIERAEDGSVYTPQYVHVIVQMLKAKKTN